MTIEAFGCILSVLDIISWKLELAVSSSLFFGITSELLSCLVVIGIIERIEDIR